MVGGVSSGCSDLDTVSTAPLQRLVFFFGLDVLVLSEEDNLIHMCFKSTGGISGSHVSSLPVREKKQAIIL